MREALHIFCGCVMQARAQPHALADWKRDDGRITTKLVDCGAACREFIAFRHGLQETASREDYSTHGCLLTFDKGSMKPGSAATSLTHLWQSQGKRQEAYDLLAPVYGWFIEGFDTADLKTHGLQKGSLYH